METWARLLSAVPGARLILHALEGDHRGCCREVLKSAGVDPGRLEFIGTQLFAQYIATYGQIDIALDPFPYTGGMTTCDALWMGVPVVSLAGQTAISRGGLSLLSTIGLPELVARTPEQYVRIAAGLAGDLPRLEALRASLRERMRRSPVMDAAGAAKDLENAFRQMWRQWCQSRSSQSDTAQLITRTSAPSQSGSSCPCVGRSSTWARVLAHATQTRDKSRAVSVESGTRSYALPQ